MKFKLLLLCALGIASANAMACYTVYDNSNRVVYSGEKPPVDMSHPLHRTIRPGYHMVFDAAVTDCAAIDEVMRRQPTASSSPLLTDRTTASELKLQHTVTAAGVAVVPASATARLDLPTFNVVASDGAASTLATAGAGTSLAARPSAMAATAVMGAARSPTSILGAGPAPAPGIHAAVQRRDQPQGPVPQGHGIRFIR